MEILTMLLTGSATGLLGSFLSFGKSFVDGWQRRLDKREERTHELKLLEMQARAKSEEAADSLRESSYTHDNLTGAGSQWLINLLRLVRPILTVALLGAVITIWFTMPEELELRFKIVDFVVYAAMTAITWWFGDRVPKKYSQRD